jgi:pyrroline-5-carboxylate reductase
MIIGFVGCGKISVAVARGYAGADPAQRPQQVNDYETLYLIFCQFQSRNSQIIVSPRNEKKSAHLKEEFPDLITIAESNEEVVRLANVIFIGLLPGVAREVLPGLPFTSDHSIFSMMAAVDYDEVVQLCRQSSSTGPIAKIIPLTGAAQRAGPILFHPPNPELQSIISVVGTPIPCLTETQLKPLISITGQISPFYELLHTTHKWALAQGIPADEARLFVSSFYSGLANTAFNCDTDFARMSHLSF